MYVLHVGITNEIQCHVSMIILTFQLFFRVCLMYFYSVLYSFLSCLYSPIKIAHAFVLYRLDKHFSGAIHELVLFFRC